LGVLGAGRERGGGERIAAGVGSKMVIAEEGLVGTIGGGCGEADVLTATEDVRETGRPKRVRLELMDDQESWSPAVCGGVMNVFLERVDP
ncbi:MAG: XdhC family protein, partial [Gemmatimonadota bacterium]